MDKSLDELLKECDLKTENANLDLSEGDLYNCNVIKEVEI